MKTITYTSALILAALTSVAPAKPAKPAPPAEAKVQIAILLDTSSSMNGLIDQTKTQLWKVVNSFIAGNEPFTQGPVDAMQASRDAQAKGIIVNTIHCGPRQQGISGSWHEGATHGGGEFMIIDQDRTVRHIPTPQDEKIAKLGVELNKTYLGYGKTWATNAFVSESPTKVPAITPGSGLRTLPHLTPQALRRQ